ncbi:hypothetical protein, partial [Microcoleus sp. B9-D4]
SFLDGRDAHPTITIKIVSYLIRDPKLSGILRCIFRAGGTPNPYSPQQFHLRCCTILNKPFMNRLFGL